MKKITSCIFILLLSVTGIFFLYGASGGWQPGDGVCRAFYKDGTIKEKGKYRHLHKEGTWYYYNEKGITEKKEKYRHGALVWQMFFENGKVVRTIDKNGKVVERPKCGC